GSFAHPSPVWLLRPPVPRLAPSPTRPPLTSLSKEDVLVHHHNSLLQQLWSLLQQLWSLLQQLWSLLQQLWSLLQQLWSLLQQLWVCTRSVKADTGPDDTGSLNLTSALSLLPQAWSPYRQTESVGDLDGCVEDKSRSLYSHEEYISLVLNSGSGLRHDYVSQSIQEDPRMMAFFDTLVRREIEGWSSDSDSDLSEGAILQLHARGRRSTRAVRDAGSGAGVLVEVGAASPVHPAAAATGDSEHSSSSLLAAPEASGAESPEGVEPLL
uniref:Uncharacterized protein n=1 Tax=Hucho hucho TaxID=62062 RepID=A0A4W5LSN0_9TELE